ncbi:MAG: indole-3-glycerol phosphate synthase TrpC [Coriobacteriia bacterium]|nr:indole-3-glycerol phosphate synthase TrpC [Coriobacteriia bacterium]MCL2137124.1 indole-3-glycerol phosphate synthase TrpC [Coriobacteriia bacterium]
MATTDTNVAGPAQKGMGTSPSSPNASTGSILQQIAASTYERVKRRKAEVPEQEMIEAAYALPVNDDYPFEQALRSDDIAFICEVKKASPSKGLIASDYPYLAIAQEYALAGAAAISVLTEPDYFFGDNKHLQEIAKAVSLPLLRKDFVIDSYMVYEAKALGASAVLLICALLDEAALREYLGIAQSLGLSALVEVHDLDELNMGIRAGARVIGVNNRDLTTFAVDTGNSLRLRETLRADVLFVSESGIQSASDIEALRQAGVDAVLVGEAMMRAHDKIAKLAELRGVRL